MAVEELVCWEVRRVAGGPDAAFAAPGGPQDLECQLAEPPPALRVPRHDGRGAMPGTHRRGGQERPAPCSSPRLLPTPAGAWTAPDPAAKSAHAALDALFGGTAAASGAPAAADDAASHARSALDDLFTPRGR